MVAANDIYAHEIRTFPIRAFRYFVNAACSLEIPVNGFDGVGGGRDGARRISKKRLMDRLNCAHFMEETIIVRMEHVGSDNSLFLRAYPQPCSGDTLHCVWAELPLSYGTAGYTARNFMIDRGLDLLVVEPLSSEVTDTGATFVLPEESCLFRSTKTKRYASEGVRATLTQNAATFSGTLEHFTVHSFRVQVSSSAPQAFQTVEEESPLHVALSDGRTNLFNGECRLIRQSRAKQGWSLVLEPLYNNGRKDNLLRHGQRLVPRWGVAFNHPLHRKRITLEVDEISTTWFAAVENYESATLFPGLVIPHVELEVAPGFFLVCRARVSSGDLRERGGRQTVKWTFLILDMSIDDQGKLFSVLQKAQHPDSQVCGAVDVDELLAFFFDAGFVYPEKYEALQPYKEQLRETYKRLYLSNLPITRHFMQLDRGVIQAHLSMIRFYENTWLLHHHAAIGQNGAGLKVLDQVHRYVTDYRSLYSSHMHYLVCYYRSDNRFPNRLFGRFAQTLADPRQCSIDAFAYLNLHFETQDGESKHPEGWSFVPAGAEDLREFSAFYSAVSGGLLLEALDLTTDEDTNSLSDEYKKLGFKREKRLFSLKKNGHLRAVILMLVSDFGLNLSNLTNCVHVFVVDGEDMTSDVLYHYVRLLSDHYAEDEVPLLLYPLSYAEDQSIAYDRVYNLWALDTNSAEKFCHVRDRRLEKSNSRLERRERSLTLIKGAVPPR